MDIRVLQNFLHVADSGALSRAATRANIAQPALSRQMTLLEEEMDAQLFVRHRRGVALTEAGQLFRERAAAILDEYHHAREAVSSAALEPSGTVSLGLPTSMIYVLSGDLVQIFHQRYPKVFLRVHEAVGHVVERLAKDGSVDAAILIEPRPVPGIALSELLTEKLYLVGPREAALEIDRPIPPDRVAEVPMVMLAPENHVRTKIESALARKGLALNAALEVEGQPLALDLVRRGLGYTVLPYCAVRVEMAAGHLSGAPIDGLGLGWTLGVNRARAGAPAVAALVDTMRELVAERAGTNEWQEIAS